MRLRLGIVVAAIAAVVAATGAFGVSGSDKITTIAGTGKAGFSGDGGRATSAQLSGPDAVAVDGRGNVYIADRGNHRVRRVSPGGRITTFAGTGKPGFSGDGGPATSAQLNSPSGVAIDRSGNVYIADLANHRLRKVGRSGTITTIAGTGVQGISGDGGPATSAQLNSPVGVAVDGRGNVYFSEGPHVRKVSPGGRITTFAGTGTRGFSGDGGPATSARLNGPEGVAVDGRGSLYIADYSNSRVRKVTPDGRITTIAGTGRVGFSGDGGPATSARLLAPVGVAVDVRRNVYIADDSNQRVRKVGPGGTITTIAGTGEQGFSGDGGPATSARLGNPYGVAVDRQGNVYIAEYGNNRVRKISKAPVAASKSGYFKTPSGNIVCYHSPGPADLPRAFLGCGIKSGLKPAPPRRPCQDGGYAGDRVSMFATGSVSVPDCAGDPGALVGESRARVLGYGKTWSGGGIRCSSAETGLTCRNKSGHGFFLSRERWRRF